MLSVALLAGLALAGGILSATGKVELSYYVIVLLAGIGLLGSIPFQTKLDAKRQVVNNPAYANATTYRFNGYGISMQQGKKSSTLDWSDITKVVGSKKAVGFYYGRGRYIIIPREIYEMHAKNLGKLIEDKLNAKAIRL